MDCTDRWELLHAQPRYRPLYPHEAVVAWTFRQFPRGRAGQFHILDLGCGAGRHALFLAQEGYRVTAVDASRTGVTHTRERALARGVTIDTEVAAADKLPFADAVFDGVVCYAVLYYLPYPDMVAAIAEIHRVLKPGASSLIVTRTDSDARFRDARLISPHTYRLGLLGQEAPSDAENGMVMTALGRSDVERVFAAFAGVVIDRATVTSGGGAFVDDDWHVRVVK